MRKKNYRNNIEREIEDVIMNKVEPSPVLNSLNRWKQESRVKMRSWRRLRRNLQHPGLSITIIRRTSTDAAVDTFL